MLSPNPSLSHLAQRQHARVAGVDWDALQPAEARRLREFGLDEGVEIELLHRAWLGGGPVACRIGRMMVALRPHVAAAIRVTLAVD
nr:FeoA family protein [uncultured Sphingomonas sp.]